MIPMLIAVLLGFSALGFVVYPLLGLDRRVQSAPVAGSTVDMSERERAAKQALLDVDFDYRLGNLDEQDYASLRDRYEEGALLALKARYEREQELDALIEQQLATLKAREKKPGTGVRQQGKAVGDSYNGNGLHSSRQRRRKGG